MKLRSVLALSLALGAGMITGCDKGEEEKKAAEAAAKKAQDEAALKVAEANKQVEAAAAEAKKAAEAASAEAEKAKKEAEAKVAEATAAAAADAAKAVEAAKATGAAEAQKAAEAAAAAAAEEAKKAVLGRKDQLVQLAIDIGCLKKKETDAQKMLQEESDLLAAAELDQTQFLKDLEALKGADAESGPAIDAAVAACPTAEDVIRGKVIGIQVFNQCLRQANVKAERLGQLQTEILNNYGLTAEDFNKLRDQYKAEPWFKPSLDEGLKSCPPIAEDEIQTEEEAKAKNPPPAADKPDTRPTTSSLKGNIFGSANGKISVQLTGKRITAGTITIGTTSMPVSGYVLAGSKIAIKGSSGADNIRGFGKFDGSGARIIGNWNGNIGGQRRSGSFILNR
jgi:hypothetical protein